MNILIADDHAIVRRGLKQILLDRYPMANIAEADNSQEVLNFVGAKHWDIVLLDISMPGKSGLEVLKELRKRYSKLPVLILSTHPEEQYAIRVLKAGAAGYITKETAPEQLLSAVQKVIS